MTKVAPLRRWLRPLPVLTAAPLAAVLALAFAQVPAGGSLPQAEPTVAAARATATASIQSFAASELPPPATPAAAAVLPRPALTTWGPAPARTSDAPMPEITGIGAIVLDEASATVLYEKDAHVRLPPASLTKIMTALLALERGDLGSQVEVGVDSRLMRGSTVMGLVPGERLTLEDLLYGLMLPSGNDAALAIAAHISGSTEAFVALMNQRAAELGLTDTHFVNPHGLDNAAHYTSAYDLAMLTRVAMQRPDFRQIVGSKYYVARGAFKTYPLGTLNPLFSRVAGVDGVKTGYTRSARQTIVGSVTRDGHRVYVVVLRSPDRASDSVALLNWAFGAYAWPPPPSSVSADSGAEGT